MTIVSRAACVALIVAALTPIPAAATTPWWQQLSLGGMAVSEVVVMNGTITVHAGSGAGAGELTSSDGGRTFTPVSPGAQPAPSRAIVSGSDTWSIAAGRVVRARGGGALQPDPGGPHDVYLLAAVPGDAGALVAVARGGTVWRRSDTGEWRTALLLLPQGLGRGTPTITAVSAFDRPVTGSVYMATAGYSVLISTDGGDDWIRAGPGLPDTVYGLATDSRARAVYAATADGLWVHHVQAFPAPPAYHDAQLVWRWIGMGLVTLLAAALALLGMQRMAPSRR